MGYKVLKSGSIKKTTFPKKLSAAQIKQIENSKVDAEAIAKALKATAKVNFRGLAAGV